MHRWLDRCPCVTPAPLELRYGVPQVANGEQWRSLAAPRRWYSDSNFSSTGSNSCMLRLETFNKPANSAASSTSSEPMISGIDNVACTPLACAAATNSGAGCLVAAIATRTGRPRRAASKHGHYRCRRGTHHRSRVEQFPVMTPADRVWRLLTGVSPRPCLHCG